MWHSKWLEAQGEISYETHGGFRWKFGRKLLKETNLGVAQGFVIPKRNPKYYNCNLFFSYLSHSNLEETLTVQNLEHPKRDRHPKFTPLSKTASIPVCFIWKPAPQPPWAQSRTCCNQRFSTSDKMLNKFSFSPFTSTCTDTDTIVNLLSSSHCHCICQETVSWLFATKATTYKNNSKGCLR